MRQKIEFPLRLLEFTSSDLSSNFFSCTVLTCGYVILLESRHHEGRLSKTLELYMCTILEFHKIDITMVHRHVVWLGFAPSLFLYSNALLNQITNQLYFRKYSSLGGAFLQHVFSQVQKFLLTSPLTTKVKQCSYNRSIKIKISRRRKCSFFSFWPFCFCILCRYCCCCFIRPYFYHFITASRGVAINV